MPFVPSDSIPRICGACWRQKEAHAPEGECPEAKEKRIEIGPGPVTFLPDPPRF